MAEFLWKPVLDGAIGGGRGGILADNSWDEAELIDAQGNVIERLKLGRKADHSKFYASQPGYAYPNAAGIRLRGSGGKTSTLAIQGGGNRWKGEDTDGNTLKVDHKAGSSGGGAFPGGMSPFGFGAGMAPGYMGGQFPAFNPVQFQPTNYDPIKTPDYKMYDPVDYTKNYGKAITPDILANFGKGGQLAMDTLATELRGLKAFEPAAAALAREQAAVDNLQNQSQRTQQLQRTLPGVLSNLSGQTDRAATYATGRLPNSIDDAALEYGVRSRSADITAQRGFGSNSQTGKNVSDIMSAEKRFEIAQYGENLVGQNAQGRAALELAPTEYINAGQQIKVTPSIDAGQYQKSYFGDLNQQTILPVGTAFQGAINQSQFGTNLRLDVSKFNATNTLQNAQYNATTGLQAQQYNSSNMFSSQLGAFNYNTGYANTLAGLGTAEVNQTREDQIRTQLTSLYGQSKSDAQAAKTWESIIGAGGTLASVAQSIISSYGDEKGATTSTPSSSGSSITTGTGSGYVYEGSSEQSAVNTPYNPPTSTNVFQYDTSYNTSANNPFVYNSNTDSFGYDYQQNYGVDMTQFSYDLGLATSG